MEQAEKRKYLIKTLLAEQPGKISEDFLKVQDEYLQEETKEKGITDLKDLQPMEEGIYMAG